MTNKIVTRPAIRKAYQTPKIKTLGNVKKLTLKTGSNTDMMGGHL
ncbi:hypothetical protein [Spirosoma agri]|nr:hypothetical protein [Spirosoma agri]